MKLTAKLDTEYNRKANELGSGVIYECDGDDNFYIYSDGLIIILYEHGAVDTMTAANFQKVKSDENFKMYTGTITLRN